jgi:BMFP domain-containing protein YqiC
METFPHLGDEKLCRAAVAGAEALAIADHLASCAACRARAWELARVEERVDWLRSELADSESDVEHLSYALMEGWVDDALDLVDREIVDSHLEICPRCRREVEDLSRVAAAHRSATAIPRRHLVRPTLGLAAAVVLGVVGVVILVRTGIQQPLRPVSPTGSPGAGTPADGGADALARVVMVRDASGPITRSPGGRIDGLPAAEAGFLVELLAGRSAAPPILAALAVRGEQLRDVPSVAAQPVELLTPVAVVAVDAMPRFEWRAPAEHDYTVEVFALDLTPIRAATVRGLHWKPGTSFAPGTYLWQLRALDAPESPTYPQPPLPPARFHVLAASAREEIAQARASRSHLALALALARHGAIAEAQAELRRLAALDPASELPRRLAGELASWLATSPGGRRGTG